MSHWPLQEHYILNHELYNIYMIYKQIIDVDLGRVASEKRLHISLNRENVYHPWVNHVTCHSPISRLNTIHCPLYEIQRRHLILQWLSTVNQPYVTNILCHKITSIERVLKSHTHSEPSIIQRFSDGISTEWSVASYRLLATR